MTHMGADGIWGSAFSRGLGGSAVASAVYLAIVALPRRRRDEEDVLPLDEGTLFRFDAGVPVGHGVAPSPPVRVE